jgi:CubicO group peptidase (beta-lactamase class C family)
MTKIISLLFLSVMSCGSFVSVVAQENPLSGIWMSSTTFGPLLTGELRVTREHSDWRATLSSAKTTFHVVSDSVYFAFPPDLGRFRGVLSHDEEEIRGFWIQPEGVLFDVRDAGGSSQRFATPLTLVRVGQNSWRGAVRPLENRFTLYLKIFPDTDGTLVGAFRNPEQNSYGGATQFRVTRDNDSVRFSTRSDIRLAAFPTADQLRIFWPGIGRVLEMTRCTPGQAAAFFPRPPEDSLYAYRKPLENGDGWPTAPARNVGFDERLLTLLVQRLIVSDPAARRPALIHSLLVARHGKLVLEEYFFGFDREMQHDTRSAGKTFASVMLGATMMRGGKVTPESRLYDLLATLGPFSNPDPRKSRITVAHLMTHTSGFIDDDEDKMQTQREQPDWWKYTLDLPVAHEPGGRYTYSSAGMNLVGAALTIGTGTWLPELFDRTVARPLQFGRYYWNLMPTDEGYLGGGAYLLPRDLLKLGQLYLNGGIWKGQRLVDSSWVSRSTMPHVEVSESTTGLDPDEFPNFYAKSSDGYAWHIYALNAGGRVYREYEANGNGGQFLIVVPELDLTVVMTGGNYGQGGIWGRWRNTVVSEQIIPSIRN